MKTKNLALLMGLLLTNLAQAQNGCHLDCPNSPNYPNPHPNHPSAHTSTQQLLIIIVDVKCVQSHIEEGGKHMVLTVQTWGQELDFTSTVQGCNSQVMSSLRHEISTQVGVAMTSQSDGYTHTQNFNHIISSWQHQGEI